MSNDVKKAILLPSGKVEVVSQELYEEFTDQPGHVLNLFVSPEGKVKVSQDDNNCWNSFNNIDDLMGRDEKELPNYVAYWFSFLCYEGKATIMDTLGNAIGLDVFRKDAGGRD